MEGEQGGGARVAQSLGSGETWLAHRVLGHGLVSGSSYSSSLYLSAAAIFLEKKPTYILEG